MDSFGWPVDIKRERENRHDDKYGENDITEDDCRHGGGYSDDAHGPEPIGASLLVFVFVRVPLHLKRSLSHAKIVPQLF